MSTEVIKELDAAEHATLAEQTQEITRMPLHFSASNRYLAYAVRYIYNDVWRRTARILSPSIARSYTEVLTKRHLEDEEDPVEALMLAREDVAALGMMENLSLYFDAEAKKLSDAWFAEYRERIQQLSDDRQETYRQLIAYGRGLRLNHRA